ncbi:MAG TPA: nitroreductase family deazaflavin-dependent oxidoreductase [Microbacterium sp.]|nr:nitroreductase family deazaflavin-dependent oxidoreductase [Microbacterium sp.]
MSDRKKPPAFLIRLIEPVAFAMSGRRLMPVWATIHHTGRKTGRALHTPIAVVPARDAQTVIIGLPWGLDTNWARNVVAAGGATLTWKGRDVWVTDPRILKAPDAAPLAKAPFDRIVRWMPGALVLKVE